MDRFCIYCLFALTEYLSLSYPKDIIILIVSLMYRRIQVSCSSGGVTFAIDNDIYEYPNIFRDPTPTQYDWTFGLSEILPRGKNSRTKNQIKRVLRGGKIKFISSGSCYSHKVLLTESGKIYVWGRNDYGQLGLGTKCNRAEPTLLNFGSKINSIKCGDFHTVAVTEIGECFVCGNNEVGQLGLGDNMDRDSFQKLGVSGVIKISCCAFSSISIILTKSECFVCGDNHDGQLGLGDKFDRNSLQKLDLSNIILIEGGYNHTVAVTSDGFYSWGYNELGQLGLGNWSEISELLPRKVELEQSIVLHIISIKCGGLFTIFLTEFGELFMCGYFADDNNCPNKLCVFRKLNLFQFIVSSDCAHGYEYTIAVTNRQCTFRKLSLFQFIESFDCNYENIIFVTKAGKCYSWNERLHDRDSRRRNVPTLINF